MIGPFVCHLNLNMMHGFFLYPFNKRDVSNPKICIHCIQSFGVAYSK